MTNKEFDIIFNQKLQQYTAPVPNGLWEKIAAKDLSGPQDGFDEFIQHKLYNHSVAVPANFWERIKPEMRDIFGNHSSIDRIILDEAYMLLGYNLDIIDYKLKKIRKNKLPFGGIQVVAS